MHSRDRREFGRRRMKIKNKWEAVLVLTVIAAGIVITTVAAIKAKERRRIQAESKSINTTIKPIISHVREVVNNQSVGRTAEPSNIQFNKKRIMSYDKPIKRHRYDGNPQPDYDVEYDLVKSGADEYTALASESIDNIPRNRIRVLHDGLPGFPPPFGISNDVNANVELSADAAGFLLEIADPSTDNNNRNGFEDKKEVILKTSANTNSEMKTNVRQMTNKAKTSIKLMNFNNNNNKNNNNNENKAPNSEPKQRIPVFVDPPKDISEPKLKSVHMRAQEPKHDVNIAIPVKIVSRMPIPNDQMPNISPENSGSLRISLPALEPGIRLLSLSDDYRHSMDYGLPGVQQGVQPGIQPGIQSGIPSGIGNIPVHMRRFLSPEMGKAENPMQTMNGNPNSKIRSKRESERRFILRQLKPKSNRPSSEDLKDEPKTGESRFMPFNERSFMSDSNEDNDSEDSEQDSDDENLRPLFNFDDIESRFPSVLSSSRDNQRNDDNFSSDESRTKHKYGLLGSGNFEIIKGGIYSDEESASNNVPNYVNDNENTYENNNHRKSDDQVQPQYHPSADQSNEDDSEPNDRFPPFNIDFFTNNPVLGFQGYDNFDATSVDKYKAPVPVRSGGQGGQRRHFYDSHSDDSNLHFIYTDKDLLTDS